MLAMPAPRRIWLVRLNRNLFGLLHFFNVEED
jgi:hypothetical protein